MLCTKYCCSARFLRGRRYWTRLDPGMMTWLALTILAFSILADPLVQLHRFSSTIIPIFLSEYGGSSHQPRHFQETTALYSPAMNRIFSGGCVYEFCQSANGYGLVEMLKNGSDK